MITQRQENILNTIIEEYIDSVQPVSSQLLEKKYDFEICPATIRIEMKRLTDKGYLAKPHTSSGRIPTDRGYRLYVDSLMKDKAEKADKFWGINREEFSELGDEFQITKFLTRALSSASSNLALGYLLNEKVLWKEGWTEVIREPEFEEIERLLKFAEMIDDFDEGAERYMSHFATPEVRVYIGKENPISRTRDFSIITSRFDFPLGDGFFAILGPVRMAYQKNINLMKSIINLLEKYQNGTR